MKTRLKILLVLLIALGSFLSGYFLNSGGGRKSVKAGRTILHYVDPMNPALKSDKPGIAPCGMPLEPVYADQGGTAAGGSNPLAAMPPGTIRISPEKQQLIGVRTVPVEKVPWSHTLRVLGRVTPDETLVYRITAPVDCLIKDALPVTTGSVVRKNELLATFYSPEYRSSLWAYFNIVRSDKSAIPGGRTDETTAQRGTARSREGKPTDAGAPPPAGRSVPPSPIDNALDNYKKTLFNYGMSEYQMEEIERTKTISENIEVRAPASGFILFRNVSPGLRLEKGAEFFRLADLSRVWVAADVFETEASFFRPGMRVRMELPYQKKTLHAKVSDILPLFDPATRTLKVRLIADNPGYVMRPDMFVNVEMPISGPPAIIVPAEAVLDSGLRKTVFVDRGNGFFEPRQVETGRSLGERVEISRGLAPGERIVVSGNFLIDSETRMQQAASGTFGKTGRDPVCGMNIDEDRARAEGNFLAYGGKTYFFCSPGERDAFRKNPERYLKPSPARGNPSMPASSDRRAMPGSRSAVSAPGALNQEPLPEPPAGGMSHPTADVPEPDMQGMHDNR